MVLLALGGWVVIAVAVGLLVGAVAGQKVDLGRQELQSARMRAAMALIDRELTEELIGLEQRIARLEVRRDADVFSLN